MSYYCILLFLLLLKDLVNKYLFLQRLEKLHDLVLALHGHGVHELAAVRMQDLQPVVTGVRDAFDADLWSKCKTY